MAAVPAADWDVVVVALDPGRNAPLGDADFARLATVAGGARLAQFWGDVDRAAAARHGFAEIVPAVEPEKGHMGILLSAVGPEPIIRLQAGGLKAAEFVRRGGYPGAGRRRRTAVRRRPRQHASAPLRSGRPAAVGPAPPNADAALRFRYEDVELEAGFGAVGHPQLLHDVADVHLHRALAHVELVGDQLVRLAAAQAVRHGRLPRGELLLHDAQRPLEPRRGPARSGSRWRRASPECWPPS